MLANAVIPAVTASQKSVQHQISQRTAATIRSLNVRSKTVFITVKVNAVQKIYQSLGNIPKLTKTLNAIPLQKDKYNFNNGESRKAFPIIFKSVNIRNYLSRRLIKTVRILKYFLKQFQTGSIIMSVTNSLVSDNIVLNVTFHFNRTVLKKFRLSFCSTERKEYRDVTEVIEMVINRRNTQRPH